MIRPATLLSIAAAFGSGLYLYAEKHEAGLLDKQIGQVFKATQEVREQTKRLQIEWALLNDPQRLQDMAGKYLSLKTIEPAQYVQLEQLGDHLPSADGAPPKPAPVPAVVTPATQVAEAAAPTPDAPLPDASAPDAQVPGAAFVDAPDPPPKIPAKAAAAPPLISAPMSPVKAAPRVVVARIPVLAAPPARAPEHVLATSEPRPRQPRPMLFARAEPPRMPVVTAHATNASFEMTMERLMRAARPAPAPAVVSHQAAAHPSTGYLPDLGPAHTPVAAPSRPAREVPSTPVYQAPRQAQPETDLADAQPVQRPAYPRWASVAQPRYFPQPYYAAAPGYSYAPPGYYGRY